MRTYIFKMTKTVLFLLIIFLIAFFLSSSIFPTYFKGDDAEMAVDAKYFGKHMDLIFSPTAVPAPFYVGANMPMWGYYRPVERLYWTVLYGLFGLNEKPFHVIQIFLFLLTLIILFKITNHISGTRSKIPGFLFTAVFLIFFFEHAMAIITFLSHTNTILMLFFMFLALLQYFEAYQNRSRVGLLLGMICTLIAFFSKEWACYMLPAILFMYFYTHWSGSDEAQTKIIFKSSVFVFSCLLLTGVLQFIFRSHNVYKMNADFLLGPQFMGTNILYVVAMLNEDLTWVLILSGVISLLFFRNKGQWTAVLWSILGLVMPLFYRNLCSHSNSHYLLIAMIGLSVFISIGLYWNAREVVVLMRRRERDRSLREILNTSFLKMLLLSLNIVLIPAVVFTFAMASLKLPGRFQSLHRATLEEYDMRKKNLERAVFAPPGVAFFVPDLPAEQFYKAMLYLFAREDVKLKVFGLGDLKDVKNAGKGENLLSNNSFESGWDGWKVEFKKIYSIASADALPGPKSLEIDLEKVSRLSDDFIDITQTVKAKPGRLYMFGGWLKANEFDGRFWIETRDARGWQFGNCAARYFKDMNGVDEGWTLVSGFFAPQAEAVTFVVVRTRTPLKGKISLKELFLFPVNEGMLLY